MVPMVALRRESFIPIGTLKERRSRTHNRNRSELLILVGEEVLQVLYIERTRVGRSMLGTPNTQDVQECLFSLLLFCPLVSFFSA